MLLFMTLSFGYCFASCSDDDPGNIPETEIPGKPDTPGEPDPDTPESPGTPGGNEGNNENGNNEENNPPMSHTMTITAGGATFTATLAENAAATAFKRLLPLTANMSDMNRNEKYFYLPGSLPTAASNPGTIRAGDLMLYGSNCVVLFYETFATSYSYTRIGSIDNPSELKTSLGSGSATVTFTIRQQQQTKITEYESTNRK